LTWLLPLCLRSFGVNKVLFNRNYSNYALTFRMRFNKPDFSIEIQKVQTDLQKLRVEVVPELMRV
jgi:hypothetical protein